MYVLAYGIGNGGRNIPLLAGLVLGFPIAVLSTVMFSCPLGAVSGEIFFFFSLLFLLTRYYTRSLITVPLWLPTKLMYSAALPFQFPLLLISGYSDINSKLLLLLFRDE